MGKEKGPALGGNEQERKKEGEGEILVVLRRLVVGDLSATWRGG